MPSISLRNSLTLSTLGQGKIVVVRGAEGRAVRVGWCLRLCRVSQVWNRRRALHRLVLRCAGPRRRSVSDLLLQNRRRGKIVSGVHCHKVASICWADTLIKLQIIQLNRWHHATIIFWTHFWKSVLQLWKVELRWFTVFICVMAHFLQCLISHITYWTCDECFTVEELRKLLVAKLYWLTYGLCELSFDLKLITFMFSEVLSNLVPYILSVSVFL